MFSLEKQKNIDESYTKISMNNIPIIILIGRSNVGKSSFLNSICDKKLAITSKKQGSTKRIDIYYDSKNKFYLIDLPGYGYLKTNKEKILILEKKLNKLFLNFRHKNEILLFHLIDSRHFFLDNDINAKNYFDKYNFFRFYIFTKADKLNQSQKHKILKQINNLTFIKNYLFYSLKFNKLNLVNNIESWINSVKNQ